MNDFGRTIPINPPSPLSQASTLPTKLQRDQYRQSTIPDFPRGRIPSHVCGLPPSKARFPFLSYSLGPGNTNTNAPQVLPDGRTRTYVPVTDGLSRLSIPSSHALSPTLVPHLGSDNNTAPPWMSSLDAYYPGIGFGGGPNSSYSRSQKSNRSPMKISSVSPANVVDLNAILLHTNESKPRLITIPFEVGPQKTMSVLGTSEWFSQRNSAVELQYFNHTAKDSNGRLFSRKFCICHDANSIINQLPPNRCIMEITKDLPSKQWSGNIVVLKLKTDIIESSTYNLWSYRLYADVKMEEDLKAVKQYFKEYNGTK